MPKTVDHHKRRAMILDALFAVAARQGLHAASLRAVAAEAGISLRLVQYYFQTKAGLMQAGLDRLERESNDRWAGRLAPAPDAPDARARLAALFREALPTDPQSRAFHHVWLSYAVLAMTEPDLAGPGLVAGPNRLQARIAAILADGKEAGMFRADIDVDAEAGALLGLIHGLGTAMLVGQQKAAAALAHLERQLDRLCVTKQLGENPSHAENPRPA